MSKNIPLSENLILKYQKMNKQKLFTEARRSKAQIPMLQIDGVLMNPKESLQYLKLRVEAYQKAKKEQQEVKMVCPTCGSVPHL